MTTADALPHVNPRRLPKRVVWSIFALSVLPFCLNLLGIRFGVEASPVTVPIVIGETTSALEQIVQRNMVGSAIHTIWEWTAFCIALFTVCFSLAHFYITRDPTTPIIGTALFFTGMIDAFRILSADGVIATAFDHADFIPFTWMISRTFNVVLLIAGCAPFLFGHPAPRLKGQDRGILFIILVGILFGLMAYAIIHLCAVVPKLPTTMYPDRMFPRPWDVIPLVLYMFAGGIVFPRFYRLRPSLFSHALRLSVIPNLAAEAHAALGSRALFDNDFNISLYLKVVAYLVPLTGLVLDYVRAYGNEVELKMIQQKLQVASDVQQGLLPQRAPELVGFDIAGILKPVDAAGGDYYDFIPMRDNSLGVVVADVSGHDVGASILMAVTRAYLRAVAAADHGVEEITTRVNQFLSQDVQNRWLVTMFLARIDPVAKTLDYAAAGHECYLIRADNTLVTLKNTGPPLGVLEDSVIPRGPQQQLHAGDIALLMTDGILEATSPTGEQFGIDNIQRVVVKHRNLAAAKIVQELLKAMRTHCGTAKPHDDVTVVVIKATDSDH